MSITKTTFCRQQMEHAKHLKNFLINILFTALFLISGNIHAAGACSTYMGQASLNEFYKDLTTQAYSANDFVEVKILNGTILSTTFETWKIKLCEKFDGGSQNDNDGCSATVSLSSFTNLTKPWLVIDGTAVTGTPATNIEIGKYINFKTGFDAILLDANDDIIDYVSVSGYSPQLTSFTSCTTSNLPFDWQFSYGGASPKLMSRSPDGIGKWHGSTSAVAPGTIDSTNDSGTVGKSEWYMDELSWNSTANEVTDQSTNLNHGTAYNGLTTVTPGKLCNGGSFDGINDYIEIPHNDSLQGSGTLTYAAWINPTSWSGSGINQVMAKSVHGGTVTKSKTPRAQMGIFSENNRLVGRAETIGDVRHEVFTSLPATSSWTHVALVFNGNSLTFYINGAVAPNADGSHRSTKSFAATTLVQNNDPLMISKRVGSNEYYFHGLIDEVLVFQPALQAAFIQTMYTNYNNGLNWDGAARSCSGSLHHFEIRHDGSGLTCEPENIYVKACTDANCTSLYPYDITVTPSPATGATTSWSPAPQVITANTETTLKLSYKSLSSSPADTVLLGITGSSPTPAS
ncbi:MAG: LamG domain-containing protein, partial [Gammaproteobacteria bacterium]|nr:LamG domain-containing protein [Gammaproteobacteria bacterium]